MDEQWKDIPGFEGRYQVSDLGRVRSLDRQVWMPARHRANGKIYPEGFRFQAGRVLSPGVNAGGYLRVVVEGTQPSVHVLVLTVFECARPEGMCAAHNDGNPANNALSNLRWTTPSDNNLDKHDHGTMLCGERNNRARLTEADVRRIREIGATMKQRDLAKLFGVGQCAIWNVLRRKTWGHVL